MSLEPTAALATVTGIVNALQALAGLSKKVNDVQFNQELIKLQSLIFDLQDKLIKLQNENEVLRTDKKDLERQIAVRARTYMEHGACWTLEGEAHDGPFCHVCLDQSNKLIRMLYSGNFWVIATQEDGRQFHCVVHKTMHVIPCRILKDKNLLFDERTASPRF